MEVVGRVFEENNELNWPSTLTPSLFPNYHHAKSVTVSLNFLCMFIIYSVLNETFKTTFPSSVFTVFY